MTWQTTQPPQERCRWRDPDGDEYTASLVGSSVWRLDPGGGLYGSLLDGWGWSSMPEAPAGGDASTPGWTFRLTAPDGRFVDFGSWSAAHVEGFPGDVELRWAGGVYELRLEGLPSAPAPDSMQVALDDAADAAAAMAARQYAWRGRVAGLARALAADYSDSALGDNGLWKHLLEVVGESIRLAAGVKDPDDAKRLEAWRKRAAVVVDVGLTDIADTHAGDIALWRLMTHCSPKRRRSCAAPSGRSCCAARKARHEASMDRRRQRVSRLRRARGGRDARGRCAPRPRACERSSAMQGAQLRLGRANRWRRGGHVAAMTPAMLEAARALAAVWTGPTLAQRVVKGDGDRSERASTLAYAAALAFLAAR